MLHHLFACLLFATPSTWSAPAAEACAAPAIPAAAPLEDEEPPDGREEIEELLDRLKDHIRARGDEDREAVAVIDELLQEFPQSGPDDREDIIDGISDCFDQRRRELEEGIPNNRLYLAAAVALGEMGEGAAKPITKVIGHKRHRDDLVLQRQLILSLGKTKAEDAIEDLLDLLNDDENILLSATAEALANFDEAPQEERKDIFNELLKLMMTTKTLKDADANDIVARERWDVIAAPIITTLQVLSGHDERDPAKWQRWWNKNKKEDWDGED